MAIWGHEYVFIEKDRVKREWRVFTDKGEPRALLCTIPWTDALRAVSELQRAQAKDYFEAVETCMSHPDTRLTDGEVEAVRRGDAPQNDAANVVRVDFKGRRTL